jgi:hypothetical protein
MEAIASISPSCTREPMVASLAMTVKLQEPPFHSGRKRGRHPNLYGIHLVEAFIRALPPNDWSRHLQRALAIGLTMAEIRPTLILANFNAGAAAYAEGWLSVPSLEPLLGGSIPTRSRSARLVTDPRQLVPVYPDRLFSLRHAYSVTNFPFADIDA